MSVYHQMGHNSRNLIADADLSLFAGAILSPVNEEFDSIREIVTELDQDNFQYIFDPQLYYPRTNRGKLQSWNYFPTDVDTVDQTSLQWYYNINGDLASLISDLSINAICTPCVIPANFVDSYYELNLRVAEDLQNKVSADTSIFLTLVVRMSDLQQPSRAAEIATIVTSTNILGIYLIFYSDIEPRKELNIPEQLSGAIRLIQLLNNNNIKTIVGYASSDIALWKYAGASDCATGKFFNLRRFTPSRWEPPANGGGQVSYWFEENFMAYFRESDIIRLNRAGLLSDLANPFGSEILQLFTLGRGDSWLAKSWRQYLYWFAEFENRFTDGMIDLPNQLADTENRWLELSTHRILTEEPLNNGAWIRQWRRAILEI